ncbi:MAG TPA: ankyrin repeat domain-containing protein, partial [Gemmatimonadales bacterium]|nr:ankyrin repeat domain-containing protein [Gemmatimonadales bacterium]
ATCWNNYHAEVAEFLVSRGARHTIFSAIALNLAAEVRRIVAADPAALNSRLTRNDGHRTPLHYAALNNRPGMVALLLDLGADPLAVDGDGFPVAAYPTTPNTDRRLMEKIRDMTSGELDSAVRGVREPNAGPIDLLALLALGDWDTAARLVRGHPELIAKGGVESGVLHLMAKRGDLPALRWLLEHGADPSARWSHWDAEVTPLHLAALAGHTDIARLLLEAGADPHIHDSKHDGDAMDWARFFGRGDIVRLLEDHAAKS